MSKESPQSMSATTATSAAPSSYWGLGTPSSRPQRPELRSVPEPTGMDFTWLPIQQLRQQWHARETELAATKARADALQTMLKQQLDERKKSRFEKDEIAELSAASARQQVALATAEAALQKEQQHRRALYEEVRRLNPKWRRPCKDLVQNYQVELTDWTKTLRQSHPPHKVDRRRRSSSAAGDRPHVEAQRRRSSSVAEFRKSTFDEIPRQKLSGTSAGVLPHRDQRQAESFSAMKIFGATPDLAHDLKVSFAPAEIGGFQVDAFEPFEQSDAPSARKTDAEGGVKEVEVQTDLEGQCAGQPDFDVGPSVSSLSGAGPLPRAEETAAETVPDWPKPELNVEQREEPLDLKPEPPSLGATLSEEYPALVSRDAGTPLPEAPEATVEVPLEAQVITSQIVAEPVQIQTEPVAAVARQLTTLPLRSARAHRSISTPPTSSVPTLLSRCHSLAASRRFCEDVKKRALQQQAELKEAQCRGEALMLELFREQQELDELRRQQIVHGALRLSEPRQGVFAG